MNQMNRPLLGISLRLFSGLLAGGMYVCIKAVSDEVPLGEIVFFRSLFALLPLIIFLWMRREFPNGLATKRPMAHLLRSGFGALAMFTSFASVARLNLAEALLVAQLAPVLMAIAAVFILSEQLTVWRVGGLALGFVGVFVLVWPELGGGENDPRRLMGFLIGLASAALTAFAFLMVRNLNRTESPGAIALYFVIVSMIGALLTLPWGWIVPQGETLIWLIASGLFGGFLHIAMTLAFRYAEASRLAPFGYVALLWPLLADSFVFQLPLSTAFIYAAPLILLGAVVAAGERKS